MLVVDTSAVLAALVAREVAPGLVERLADDADLHAPHLLDTELRHDLTAYDATFVALAEALEAPLIACDARLAGAPGHGGRIELYEPRSARR